MSLEFLIRLAFRVLLWKQKTTSDEELLHQDQQFRSRFRKDDLALNNLKIKRHIFKDREPMLFRRLQFKDDKKVKIQLDLFAELPAV